MFSPPFTYEIRSGVRKDETELYARVNAALNRRHRDVLAILQAYHVPLLPCHRAERLAMRTEGKLPVAVCICFLLTMLTACEREERRFREPAPSSGATSGLTVSGLHPADPTKGTDQPPPEWVQIPYADNAYAVSEGQKLYDAYNCSGCHFHGGGGIGPPLMDNTWIYGSEPQNIYADIVEGRPNGMPSFRRQDSRSASMGDRRLCALDERPVVERRGARSWRRDAGRQPAIVHTARTATWARRSASEMMSFCALRRLRWSPIQSASALPPVRRPRISSAVVADVLGGGGSFRSCDRGTQGALGRAATEIADHATAVLEHLLPIARLHGIIGAASQLLSPYCSCCW